jgi:CotH kinase protein
VRIYTRPPAPRRWTIFTLPGFTRLLLSTAVLATVLLIGAIIGLRLADSPVTYGANKWLLDTYLARRVVTPTIWGIGAMIGSGENVPLNLLKGMTLADAKPLELDIKWEHYQALTQQRERALAEGLLFSGPDDYVPVRVRFAGKRVKAKARLKGRLPDHWSTDKWSLRIKVSGDETILGMKRFAIQAPETRNFLTEAIALAAIRREGLLAVRYRFVSVTINGEAKGIYAIEQGFDKHVLERSGRRDGPILRFDNEASLRAYGAQGDFEAGSGEFSASPIVGRAADTGRGSEFERAVALLEAFRAGRIAAGDTFHLERMATFVALRELLGSKELDWRDMRFYYDPIRSRLEPIGYDNHAGRKISKLFHYDGGIYNKSAKRPVEDQLRPNFAHLLFRDHAFSAAYVVALERVSNPEYLPKFFAEVREGQGRSLINLYTDYPYVQTPDATLRRNAQFIRDRLAARHSMHAYIESVEGDTLRILVGNTQSLPLELHGLSIGGAALLEPNAPVRLPSKRRTRAITFKRATFTNPAGGTLEPTQVIVKFRVAGSSKVHATTLHEWRSIPPAKVVADWMADTSEFRSAAYLTIDEGRKTATVRPGRWVLRKNLIVPKGYGLFVAAGSRLDLRDGAKIVSRSPVFFTGTSDTPVVIESSDGTGQGIVVLDAAATSKLQNVRFVGLGTPAQGGWTVPGAVTFYESDVDIDYVQFEGSRSEDALNVVRGEFTMRHASFVDVMADAFDGDFVSGTVSHCTFLRCGNDGIDVSGSSLTATDLTFKAIGDKAVSAGENSRVQLDNVDVRDCQLAFTSKDSSILIVKRARVRATKVAFVAFRKKTEFTGGKIEASNCELVDVTEPHLLEKHSSLTRNGKWVAPNHKSVEPLLYGNKYGRGSK